MPLSARRTAVLLAVALVCALAACGGDDDDSSPGASTTTIENKGNDLTTTGDTITVTNGSTIVAPPSEENIGCEGVDTWNTQGEQDGFPARYSRDALYRVVPQRGDKCEEIRFFLNGPSPAGYRIEYGTATTDGSGEPLTVAGNADLALILIAPSMEDDPEGHQAGGTPPQLNFEPDYFNGWSSLREVKSGGYFEGRYVFAIGVRDKLPFRVFVDLGDNDSYWTLVVQVAV